MNYTYFVSEDSVTLVNISTGNQVTFMKSDRNFDRFKELIVAGDYAAAEMLDIKTVVTSFSCDKMNIKIENGVGSIKVFGVEYPLENTIVNRIVKMSEEGFSPEPLMQFVNNLYKNPSATAIKELYGFSEASNLPITTDGCFIAYKIINNNYTDCYTSTIDNSIGQVVEMMRGSVDDNRNNTCSTGLHFCSKDYLKHYGSSRRDTDRCVLVKINPADVVSIPSDYNNAKGRTCRYEVVGEITDNSWRETLSEKDYNEKSVDDQFDKPKQQNVQGATLGNYFFNTVTKRWHRSDNNLMVSRNTVLNDNFGYTIENILQLENLQ